MALDPRLQAINDAYKNGTLVGDYGSQYVAMVKKIQEEKYGSSAPSLKPSLNVDAIYNNMPNNPITVQPVITPTVSDANQNQITYLKNLYANGSDGNSEWARIQLRDNYGITLPVRGAKVVVTSGSATQNPITTVVNESIQNSGGGSNLIQNNTVVDSAGNIIYSGQEDVVPRSTSNVNGFFLIAIIVVAIGLLFD